MAFPLPGEDPCSERFDRRQVGRPFLAAAEELCAHTGKSLDELEQMSFEQIYELAVALHGDSLPSFWTTWHDWHTEHEVPPMGDLET